MMDKIVTRDSLINALSQAAELEHALCCTYLYAAFSLKKHPDKTLALSQTELTREWMTTILLIARQEMEHLGMACNLLTAIGGAPNFHRPSFPQPTRYFPTHIRLELLPFGQTALQRFICFERPEGADEPHCYEDKTADGGSPESPLFEYHTLQQLYQEIRAGFERLNHDLGPSKLFIGPTDAQVTNETLFDEGKRAYDLQVRGILDQDPAARLQSARELIDAIILEGEGAPAHRQGSHYWRLKQIETQFHAAMYQHKSAGQPFEPAKNLVSNPFTYEHSLSAWGTPISEPFAVDLARLFNLAYEVTLLLLIRFYAHTDETPDELKALQEVAFFPMMTMAIRPLGEVLTERPAQANHPEAFAGPTFETYRPLYFLPHKANAWLMIHELLCQIAEDAQRLAHDAKRMNLPQHQRLAFISNNLARNARNFGSLIQGREAN